MPATIIDGKAVAEDVRAALRVRVAAHVAAGKRAPCLAVVLVGARPDSATYVRNKKAACAAAGITDRGVDLPESASEAEVLAVVEALNADPAVDGILVQLPLPKHVDEVTVLRRISLEKDADGLHPLNVGALALKGHAPRAVACTPKGCLELLRRAGVAIAGKRAVVLGRSNIVGIPMALLLLEKFDATRSRLPSPFTSAVFRALGLSPAATLTAGAKMPPPRDSRTLIVPAPEFATAMSGRSSLLNSPIAAQYGPTETVYVTRG